MGQEENLVKEIGFDCLRTVVDEAINTKNICIVDKIEKENHLRYMQKYAELRVSLDGSRIGLISFGMAIIAIGLFYIPIGSEVGKLVSLFAGVLILIIAALVIYVFQITKINRTHEIILKIQERLSNKTSFRNYPERTVEEPKEEVNTNNELNNCPLTSKEWILFLNGEISNLENVGHRNINNIFPVGALFITALAIIISSLFSLSNSGDIPQENKTNLFNSLAFAHYFLSILFFIFLVVFSYSVIQLMMNKKKADILKKIRNNILEGNLKDSNVIHEKWQNVMQLKFRKILSYNTDFEITTKQV